MIFHKYQGTGNDFILIDNRDEKVSLSPKQINYFCTRHFGIGADGLILLESHPESDFYMKYYNSDGKLSTMCGNGGRCIVLFAKKLGIIQSEEVRFQAADGLHEAKIINQNQIALRMNVSPNISVIGNAYLIDSGSPHYIRFTYNVDSMNVKKEGKIIRKSAQFNREGVNVNFAEEHDSGFFVRTYERGVEDETLSCGTGVTAVAIANHHQRNQRKSSKTVIDTLGGRLEVDINTDQYGQIESVWLIGPAKEVFIGEIAI